ncbi:hypothetical protein ACFXAZ_36060 [Streptomyces sp. NPDC059477]|uniref:hypothetical protein n=1 Tax=Streptomyces sp. NPDC059477 TaxID=3346847 RepID=UPI0036CA7FD7
MVGQSGAGAQYVLDLPHGPVEQWPQERMVVGGQTGDVDDAFQPPVDGTEDRPPVAGVLLQRLQVVLLTPHGHPAAQFVAGGDGVGAGGLLQPSPAENGPVPLRAGAQPAAAHPYIGELGVAVGEEEGVSGVGQFFGQPVEYRRRRRRQPAPPVNVGDGQVRHPEDGRRSLIEDRFQESG